MPRNSKPSVPVSRSAKAAARKTVAAARKERRVRRLEKYKETAARLERLRTAIAQITKRAREAQQTLGTPLRAAVRTTRESRASVKDRDAPIAAIDAGNRPLRLILKTQKRIGPKSCHRLILQTLRLERSPSLVSVAPLFPRLARKEPALSRFLVAEFAADRRSTASFRNRIADVLRHTGAFASVRVEGLRMGTLSGGGSDEAPDPGPGLSIPAPEDWDWYLSSPDTNGVDWRGYRAAIDVYGAWDVLGVGPSGETAGENFFIGHPDTGFREHGDYPESQIDLRNAFNAFLGTTTPPGLDPLLQNVARHGLTPTGFPYYERHGTFTASVMVAPRRSNPDSPVRDVVGVAPGATVLPLRCVTTVILAGDTEVTAAVEHAIARNVHVISMSLGGAPNPALRDALRAAVERDIIVVAAAGQSQGFPVPQAVAAPAAYPEVIAVGGSIGPLPWEGAFRGPEVDICAPAVNIRHAGFDAAGEDSRPMSEGTSFATAIVAGLATLWLQRHGGRAAIRQAVPGVPLQQIFRHMLKETAVDTSIFADDPPPGGWPTSLYGAGQVNARALLNRPLPLPEDVPPIDENPPFNVYGMASGIAVLDINEPWSLAAVNGLMTGLAAAGEFAAATPEMVGDLWSDFWEGPVQDAGSAVTGWVASVGAAADLAAASLRAGAAAEAWESAMAAAGSVSGELGDVLNDAAEAAEEAWEEAEDAVDEALGEAEEAVEDFVEETGNFIEETGETVTETASEAVGAVADALGGLFG